MIRLIVGILVGAVAIVFAVQNTESVDYRFLAWTLTASRAVIVIGVFVIGLFVGWLVSGIRNFKRRKRGAKER